MSLFDRRPPLRFRLSIPVSSWLSTASALSYHLPQSGVPARSHPRLLWAWSSETVSAAQVSPETLWNSFMLAFVAILWPQLVITSVILLRIPNKLQFHIVSLTHVKSWKIMC